MMKIIANWILNAVALYIVASVVPGVHIAGFSSALVAIVVIGLINALIKPLLLLLTLPITILSLGLFTFVINAFLFQFAGRLIGGFSVDGFIPALIGSILLSVVSSIFHAIVKS